MDDQKLTIEDFGKAVKTKYPQYSSLNDKELGMRILDKYPEYQTRIIPSQENIFTRVKEDLQQRGENVNNAFNKDQSFISKTLQLVGQGAGFVTDIVGEGIKSIGDVTGITKNIAKPIGTAILNTELGKLGIEAIGKGIDSYSRFKEANPETASNLEAVINIGSLLPVGKAGQVAGKAAIKTGEKVIDVTKTGLSTIKPAIQSAKNIATGISDVVRNTAKGVSNIPGRIATNVAERNAIKQTIRELPTEIAQRAVNNGVDIDDVKSLYNLPKQSKPEISKLVRAMDSFESGKSATNPLEVVGSPIVKRLKSLETEKNLVGKKLGEVANNLGKVTKPELITPVLSELQAVNGLNGLKVTNKGVLDFTDTVLASGLSNTEKKAVQKIFTEATKAGSGKSKHLLRQELFEILGGKKKSLTNLTSTEESAYEAIRKGLSNILDTKNFSYKSLNSQYAKLSEPISKINKLLRATNKDEDILNMSAGLLARRLTSNAMSNPDIRQLFRLLDSTGKSKGKSLLSVDALIDTYNTLEKYFPKVTGKTTLKGQVTGAIDSSFSVQGFVGDTIKNLAGKSDAVKKKAIKDILDEILK